MKTLSLHRGSTVSFLGLLSLATASCLTVSGQAITQAQISQNKADEQAIRTHTTAVVTQVQGLIDELAANGISGDDIKVLNATKAALSNLSGPEMDRVIASLQKAGETSNAATSQASVVTAYAGQKGIILQFRQILKDYEQRQAAYELPVRFKELSARQTETMMTAASVAKATAGKSASELTSMQQTTQQIVQADQEAISNEVALAQDQLNKAAAGSNAEDAKTMQNAQSDMKNGTLQQALADANDALKSGQLLKALKAQAVARDELRHIAQDLNPPTNAVDALKDSAASLTKLIQEQKALLDQTNAAVNVKPRVMGLDEKQGTIVDEANTLQTDMQTLSAAQSASVKDAIAPMQVSRAQLALPWGGPDTFNKAAASQQEAIDKLEGAQKDLQQQVADAQKAADDAGKDTTAKLQDLQNKIQAQQQQQQQVASQTQQALANANNATTPDTTAAQQAQQQLQQQTADMQQSAQPLSLDAAKSLSKAADEMNKAQQDLNDPAKAADAQKEQQQAQQDLAQAAQQVGQQIAQDQQQAPDPNAVAAAADALQQAQNSVSTALADATPAGTPPAGTPPAGTPPANMSAASAALAEAAKDTQAAANAKGLPDSTNAAVQQAQASIAQGQQDAAKGDAKGTADAAAAAEQALAQAQASLAMAQAGLAASSAPPPGGPPGAPEAGGPKGPPHGPHQPHPGEPDADPVAHIGAGSTDKGNMHDAPTGTGKFVTVASRDRAAIEQTQSEKRPQEYAPMIDQYMKNLADQSSASP
jgi:hypothetical protein